MFYRKVTLAIFGLDNAGKTVTAKSLQGGKIQFEFYGIFLIINGYTNLI